MTYQYVAHKYGECVSFTTDHIIADGALLWFYLEGRLVQVLYDDEIDTLEMAG